MIEDSEYETDAGGNRVLVGLSVGETAEYLHLAKIITTKDLGESHASRWLELYEKHYAALRPFSHVGVAKH